MPFSIRGAGSKSIKEVPIQKLPCELLLKLFSNFNSHDDLARVQRVCSRWRAVAFDKSLWNKFTITLNGTPSMEREDEKKVTIMPALRNICGKANNEFINKILENVIDLSKLNVHFDPPLTLSQLQAVYKKFPRLESISLSLGAVDIAECLEFLKTSEYLKEVYFYIQDSLEGMQWMEEEDIESLLLKVFRIFNGDKHFPALRKTNLLRCLFDNKLAERQFLLRDVYDFISMRSQQLLSLEMYAFFPLHMKEIISKCTNIQELDLCIECNIHAADIVIYKLTELKSLSLEFIFLAQDDDLPTFHDHFHRSSWEYLRKVKFIERLCVVEKGTLTVIINNVRQLEELCYEDWKNSTSELELCDVGNLPKLVKLSVSGLKCISDVGMSYISNCTNLRELTIVAGSFNSIDMEECICNTVRQLVKLERLIFYVPESPESLYFKKIDIVLINRKGVERFIAK